MVDPFEYAKCLCFICVFYDMKSFWYLNEYIEQWTATTSRRSCNQFPANNSHSQTASGLWIPNATIKRINLLFFILWHFWSLFMSAFMETPVPNGNGNPWNVSMRPYTCDIDLLKWMLFVNRMHKSIQMTRMTNDPILQKLFDVVQS